MSREQVTTVRVRREVEPRLQELIASAEACLRRHKDASVGGQIEAQRYQQIQAEIQAIGYSELLRQEVGESFAGQLGSMTVELLWPFAQGVTVGSVDPQTPAARRPVKEAWRPSAKVLAYSRERDFKYRAITERFESQLVAWLRARHTVSEEQPAPVCPSDIQNRGLSESLRRFIAAAEGEARVDAAVEYRDGSCARPLPLRSLPMLNEPPPDDERRLRLTLMSVRHMELDAVVDGAWFRNREISVERSGVADTDELAYLQSREQFAALSRDEPLVIELLQTGLEPANVGFYRALADHHLESSGYPVTVVPRYYEGRTERLEDYPPGTVWRIVP